MSDENEAFNVIDMMRDEFRRIQALHENNSPHDHEVQGLCLRAMSRVQRKIPIIAERDHLESDNTRLRRALEDCVKWIESCNYREESKASQIAMAGREAIHQTQGQK